LKTFENIVQKDDRKFPYWSFEIVCSKDEDPNQDLAEATVGNNDDKIIIKESFSGQVIAYRGCVETSTREDAIKIQTFLKTHKGWKEVQVEP